MPKKKEEAPITTSFTPNLALALQGTGDNSNSWGTVLNGQCITFIDQALGSTLSLSVAGSSNVTLTTAQSQYLYYTFTGALTGSISVIFPANAGRLIVVNNATTGSFTLTVKPNGGTGFLVTQGTTQFVQIEAVNNIAQTPLNNVLPFEVTLASASTTDLGSTGTNVVAISGTTTITSFGTSAVVTECLYFLRFTGALQLTYNSTNMILPGAANITTANGDTSLFKFEGSGHWRCLFYQPAAGFATGSGTVNAGTAKQLAYYASTGSAVSGLTGGASGLLVTDSSGNPTISSTVPNGVICTTQANTDSSQKLCSTGFANPGSNIASNGYTKLPSGVILQWGSINVSTSGTNLTFPLQFPNNLYSITATNAGGFASVFTTATSTTGATLEISGGGPNPCFWMAIGN